VWNPRLSAHPHARGGSFAAMLLGVDVGGTFTDAVLLDDGAVFTAKVPTTPGEESDGVMAAIDAVLAAAGAAAGDVEEFSHGMTVGTNALLEERGARTALIATKGFADLLEIARQDRPSLYHLCAPKPKPLIDPELKFEAAERTGPDRIVEPLADGEAERLAAALEESGAESLAICLLFSYLDPTHERRLAAHLRERLPDLHVSASHEVLPRFREYERASTTAIDAYLSPLLARYLGRLEEATAAAGIPAPQVMLSSGGVAPAEEAARAGAWSVLSGPAGGAVGAGLLARLSGDGNALGFDMGGTSCDVCVVEDGAVRRSDSRMIDGRPIQLPTVDVHTVGAGGGSVGWRDPGGALRVGPRSAGAQPGPACYGRGGTEPTITDANLLLGRLGVDRFLGGEMQLDVSAAGQAMRSRAAEPLGLSIPEAANGILRIAATKMSYAVKGVTTERGLDAGNFALVAYGGAGPLHATAVAREIGIRKVIIPRAPGHFSAFGMLFSDLRYDFVRTWFIALDNLDFDAFEDVYRELEQEGRAAIAKSSIVPKDVVVRRALDMRYVGQEHSVTVDIPSQHFDTRDRKAIKALFDTVHAQRYGTSAPSEPAEIASLRTTVTGIVEKPDLEQIAPGEKAPSKDALTGIRKAYFEEAGGFVDTPTFARTALLAGNRILGPALIEEHASTTVVPPNDCVEVDAIGNLVITISGPRS
jgi:N-methylhydantoinase A